MEKFVFVGIDFSKETFDASFIMRNDWEHSAHSVFENSEEGCQKFIEWVLYESGAPMAHWLVCGENTGLYSMIVSEILYTKGIFMWLENPAQVHACMGLCRGKTDKSDSLKIAQYAHRYEDKAKRYHPKESNHVEMKRLISLRGRLLSSKTSLQVAYREESRVYGKESSDSFFTNVNREIIKALDSKIKEVEKKLQEIIEKDEDSSKNYRLLTSIKGIGPMNAASIIVLTGNFLLFSDPNSFSSFCGCAPFERTSGTSVNKGKHVSKIACAQEKVLLTEAARSAVRYNPKLRDYYMRKISQGKHKNLVINNVRNKLIHLMFAVVRTGVEYDENYVWFDKQKTA